MSDQFVGEIRLFPFNFAPTGWAICSGQLMAISQNTALFSLLGTMYGGDGKSTFALPDLQGRVPMNYGTGAGLTERLQGEEGGSETLALTIGEMPAHTHTMTAGGTLRGKNASADRQSPAGAVPAIESAGVTATYSNALADTPMRAGGVTFSGPATAATAGGGTPHENRQPYLTLNYCIALQGVFPPRS
jgi:microcystin-dependent protein